MGKIASTIIASIAALWMTSSAKAQGFFAGKTLTILVNYDAGGPTDTEARILGRHLARHLPGNPTIIVQNMGGAAGLIGTKYLGEVAPKDGLMMGYLTAASQRFVSNPDQFKVDFRKYEFIALVPSGRIHYFRADVEPGLKSSRDLMKAQNLVVGGLGPDAPKDMSMRLTLDMLGVKYKYVTGYNSSAQANLALQRGEINYYAESPPDYNSKVLPLVNEGKFIPAYYDPGYDGVSFSAPKQMKDVTAPAFHDFYRSIHGKMPEGPLWEAYKTLLTVNGAAYRLLALPPGAPHDARDVLRKAVMALNDDPDYAAEARKVMGDLPEYVSSADLNESVAKVLSVQPEILKFMQDFGAKR
jgi:tripartite-type tricarboxylate transporter receptor subunit TctC